jgi:hypothetical protein
LGYKERSDWYKISTCDIAEHHGYPLLRKHLRSPAHMVMQALPDHPWLHFLFRKTSKKHNAALEKYVKQAEEQIGIKDKEEWYSVERANMVQIGHHFTDMGEFVDKVLRVVYSDHIWEIGKFKNFSKVTTQHKLKALLARFISFYFLIFFNLFFGFILIVFA